ncbi:MAG: DUF47 domain-containing protein [Dehalococcoidia bacterium]|nr:DUF47 domain-containing protein [Dehalococcoidia bacterium]
MRFPFLPREEKFYDLFEKHAATTVMAAKELQSLLDNWEGVEGKVARIREYEHLCDTLTHQVMDNLHRTFVTPIDREDIAAIAERLDDIMDFIEAAAVTMQIYKISAPTVRARELADVIVRSTQEVEKAISILKHPNELKSILKHGVEINRLENEADVVLLHALAELFDDGKYDVMEIIKWREIYEQLETATDRCEDVANVLEGIVVKNG